MLNSYLKKSGFILLCLGLFIFFSCSNTNKKITFHDFNRIAEHSISYALENKCFKFSEYEDKNENKAFGFIVVPDDSINYDTTLKFVNFKLSEFIVGAKSEIFRKDTFAMKKLGDHIVYRVLLDEVEDDFVKYHRKFSKYNLTTSNYSFIKTLLIRNPKVKYLKDKNLVLIEIDRIFERISDRTFLLITTDKSFKITQLQCLEKIKPIIPFPPIDLFNNVDEKFKELIE